MKCNLCPNNCNAEREKSFGVCNSKETLKIAKYYLHPFEEPCISGKNGSGTVFFCGCSLRCKFCQNFELSRNLRGKDITVKELADIFKELEKSGAHNINLVNPTHYTLKIIDALNLYRPNIPIVYNTHGYEKVETLKIIDDYIDVYLPDLKFYSPEISNRYTGRSDYFERAEAAIKFMAKKPIIFDKDGMMRSGTIIRHLALPMNGADSLKILEWYKDNAANCAYLSLMAQYTPFGDIAAFPELQRKLTKREYDRLLSYVLDNNLDKVFIQEAESSSKEYIPKWDF